jgi:hypothetical protein
MIKHIACGTALLLGAAGCSTVQNMTGSSSSAPAPAAAPAPAPAAKSGVREGLTASGDVTDPSKVSCGDGPKVKGINDTEGEVLGRPAPGSKFPQLKVGMGMKQVTDIAGPPTDQGAYITGKAFIPFYYGGDRHRFEMAYKGWGRLIFAGGSLGNYSGGNLLCIINYAADTGYR